eukprot:1161387-Pelagomonas_calceolata.AAC.4
MHVTPADMRLLIHTVFKSAVSSIGYIFSPAFACTDKRLAGQRNKMGVVVYSPVAGHLPDSSGASHFK